MSIQLMNTKTKMLYHSTENYFEAGFPR